MKVGAVFQFYADVLCVWILEIDDVMSSTGCTTGDFNNATVMVLNIKLKVDSRLNNSSTEASIVAPSRRCCSLCKRIIVLYIDATMQQTII